MNPKLLATAFSRRFIFFLTFLSLLFANAGTAFAGFGITPPYVDNQRLTRGTVFTQTINLVRSDPTDDLKADITMNVPGAADWITIDKGLEFKLPAGQNMVPIVITVKVPKNAEYKEFKGAIRVRTSSDGPPPEGGGVSIALGAQIDVDLKVVDKIYDFNVRKIRIADLEEGRQKWGLFFPGKMRFFIMVENTGNTEFGPTKVHFDMYDANMENLLESVDNTNHIDRVPPFGTREVVAELPTHQPPGLYVAKYTIYKNDQVAQQGQINVVISAAGTVPGYVGYGFDGLSTTDQFKVLAVVVVPAVLLAILVVLIVIRRRQRRR
jgi:hypothetical protein